MPKPSKKIDYTLSLKTTELDIDSAIGSAWSWSQYWSEWRKTADGWEVTDRETGTKYELTRKSFLASLSVAAVKAPVAFAGWVSKDMDGPRADALVQCAVLGDVIYG